MLSFVIAGKEKVKNQTSDGEKGNQTMVDIEAIFVNEIKQFII